MSHSIAWSDLAVTLRDACVAEPPMALHGIAATLAPCPFAGSDGQKEQTRCQQLQLALTESQCQLAQVRAQLEQTLQGERAARFLANHDGLTALPNRRAFLDRLTVALSSSAAQAGRLAVMFIDLDHFKSINDTFGHSVGDKLLAVVGARLSQVIRADDLAARLGGDEFACLLTHAPSSAHIARVANKLFEGIAAPVQLGSLSLQVQPSIGIATSRNGRATDAEQLMKCADRAMYRAKRLQCRYSFAKQSGEAAG